jgi:hypothetical protein
MIEMGIGQSLAVGHISDGAIVVEVDVQSIKMISLVSENIHVVP